MTDPAFWRDLRAQFESLEHPTRFAAGIGDPGPWSLTDGPDDRMRRDILHARFCTFADRGGACPSRIRRQAAAGSWTNPRQWETHRT